MSRIADIISMANPSRELFANNKIQEAICQITFKQPLDLNGLANFSAALVNKGAYKKSKPLPIFHVNINFLEPDSMLQHLNGVRISSENDDKIVQVYADHLSVHQVGGYKQWEVFKEDIMTVLEEFRHVFSVEVGRIDIRAINNFDFMVGSGLEKLSEFLTVGIFAPNIDKTNFNFTIEQVIEPGTKFTSTRCFYNAESRKFIFDLSFTLFTNQDNLKVNDISSLDLILEDGHEFLYKSFKNSITDKTRTAIK